MKQVHNNQGTTLHVQLTKLTFDVVSYITCVVFVKLLAFDSTFRMSIYN